MGVGDEDVSICVGCGLCCDGTLHSAATVRPGDEAAVLAAGLQIEQRGAKRSFQQPCPKFACGKCSIYQKRPGVCRTYTCALLDGLNAGALSTADAHERIATAKQLLAVVKGHDQSADTPEKRKALARGFKERLADASGDYRADIARALLDMALLERHLERWFLKPKNQKQTLDSNEKDGS